MPSSRLAAIAVAMLVCGLVTGASTRADETLASPLSPDEWTLLASSDSLRDRVTYAVEQAAEVVRENGTTLLPAGTVLDAVEWPDSRVGLVRMTLPAGAEFGSIPETRAQAIDELLQGAFGAEHPLAGLKVEIRVGDGDYRPLGTYLFAPAPPSEQAPPEPAAPAKGESPVPSVVTAFGGPSANADGQPVGALTGVVIYCSAGHGWTAGSSSWGLQRPLLLSMNEDYGNLDQINFFANHAYNAGAIVVPFRPVGYQSIEIVLDNDDPGVVFNGSWTSDTSATYYYENSVTVSGVRSRRIAANATETATARYTPVIASPGFYPVYCWTADRSDGVPQTYRIAHSGGTARVVVDHGRVGKGWIWLGNFYFDAGSGGYVEISNQSTASGTVTADAIRFGNGIGDVVGAGPGRISGFPREEEASRYWAESEAGINAGGLPSSIWNCCTLDSDDNVGTAARWAAQMNRISGTTERWRRAYMEFHTNAAGAKGTVALYNEGNSGTTYQLEFAQLVGEKVEANMLALNPLLEYSWGVRNPNTYHADFAYGAISTGNNGNEFEATLLEVAFHDNAEDAANLRNVAVRDAVARATVQSLVMFLSDATRFPGTQVPSVFAPDPPEQVRARSTGDGGVVVSWIAGPSRPASAAGGDPASGYKIYRSANGYGFGNAVTVGDVLTTTLTDVPADQTVYLRVAAVNAGGESMPSPTIAVRRSTHGPSRLLIVDGFDRVSRQQNHVQTLPGGSIERQIARKVNSFDYAVQHAAALAEAGYTFDYATNEAVTAGSTLLTDYAALVWILGEESSADKTFDSAEQNLVRNYLNLGGHLFVSGSEIGYELDGLGAGRDFYESTLKADFVADTAGSYNVTGTDGVFVDLGAFDFNPANGSPYVVDSPDHIVPQSGALAVMKYVTGADKPAAIQYDSGVYRLIMLGFPFEAITSAATRTALMQRAMSFLLPSGCPWGPDRLADFEGYANGTTVLFRNPRYSSSTSAHLLSAPDYAGVTDEVPGFDGVRSCKVQWQWVDASPTRWLRLTTNHAPYVPNPLIDLRRAIRVRLRLDSGSLRLALGVRETGDDGPIGSPGGTVGPIEWMGASARVPDGGPQGVLIAAQPGVWQTVTFRADPARVVPFTGNGVLEPTNGKVVLEHLALSVVDGAGPFTLYLDAVEQPCPVRSDFDGDGDVDQADFGALQRCLGSPGIAPTEPECQGMSLDGDVDIDAIDLQLFQACFGPAGVTADPACMP